MQTPKEHTRKEILEAARREFLTEGFENSSMRVIAKKAGVSTSNIYNYFENKEHLLTEIVDPILKGMEQGFAYISKPDYVETRFQDSYEGWKKRFNIALDYVDQNREAFTLLLLKSQGSALENFIETVISRMTILNMEQMQNFKDAHPNYKGRISEFVIRNLVSFFLSIFIQMVRLNISKEDMLLDEDSFLKFLHHGFKGSIASDLA